MNKLKHVRWEESAGTAQNARQRLPSLVAAYFANGRAVLAGKAKHSDLHALRLATKRLRYTLELFRSCYGPGLRARLAALRRLQQQLGDLNDCVEAARVLKSCAKRTSPQRERLDGFLKQRTLQKSGEFRRLWTGEFDAPGQEQWWTGYLARHVRQPGRKR